MPEYTRKDAKAWAKEKIKGFYMCPITPVGDDFQFDYPKLRENIDQFIDMGIEGLVVGGFIAECWNVPLREWFRYHQMVAEAARGRIPLWTIILDPSVHQALEKMEYVEKLGYEGAEVINPVVQLRTDDEIYDWFKYLTDRTPLAICLYRTPVSGKVLGFDLMRRLADIDTCVAVKQGHLYRVETLGLRRMLRDDFIVSDPMEAVFLEDLRLGGQVVWGELSYILYGKLRPLVKQYRQLAAQGKWEEARAVSDKLDPVRQFYDDVFLWTVAQTATYASALASIKVWFDTIGLHGGRIMPPVREASPEFRERIRSRLYELGVA